MVRRILGATHGEGSVKRSARHAHTTACGGSERPYCTALTVWHAAAGGARGRDSARASSLAVSLRVELNNSCTFSLAKNARLCLHCSCVCGSGVCPGPRPGSCASFTSRSFFVLLVTRSSPLARTSSPPHTCAPSLCVSLLTLTARRAGSVTPRRSARRTPAASHTQRQRG